MRIELTDEQARLHQFILKTFAQKGRSPSLVEIRNQFCLSDEASADRIIGELEKTKAIHRDPSDVLVTHAYPFSNEPTRHHVKLLSGVEVYSMCAVDALGIPFMLDQDVTINSSCKYCDEPIQVAVRDGALVSHSPNALVVGFKCESCCDTPATEQCPHINFFCLKEHLDQWVKLHSEEALKPMSLPEALARGKEVFGNMMRPEVLKSD